MSNDPNDRPPPRRISNAPPPIPRLSGSGDASPAIRWKAPDYEHAARCDQWSLQEACAYSVGIAPEEHRDDHGISRTSASAHRERSEQAREFLKRLDLAERAFPMFQDMAPPPKFISWFDKKQLSVPQQLRDAVKRFSEPQTDWKSLYEQERDRGDAAWQGFDDGAETYARELDIALQAWRAVSNQPSEKSSGTVKQRLKQWVETNYGDLGPEAVERIAVVANWDKATGRKKK